MNFKPKTIYLVIAGLVIVLLGGFYWYELRPAKIRQECSWVKHTTKAIPARPAMSEEELRAEGMIKDDCKESGYVSIFSKSFEEECERKNQQTIEEYKTNRPAVPARDSYSKASDKQYDFCIKSKGLTR